MVEEEGLAKAHGDGLLYGAEGVSSQFVIDAKGLVGEPVVQVRVILVNYIIINTIIVFFL